MKGRRGIYLFAANSQEEVLVRMTRYPRCELARQGLLDQRVSRRDVLHKCSALVQVCEGVVWHGEKTYRTLLSGRNYEACNDRINRAIKRFLLPGET